MDERKLNLLWVNLNISADEVSPDPILDAYFDITTSGRDKAVAQQLEICKPDVVCFDFDYPDRAGLRLVEEMKRLYTSMPMFVATVQHSEELAVWAFRSRMMDFLVKPLKEEELLRVYGLLMDIVSAKSKQENRRMTRSEHVLPPSVVSTPVNKDINLEPALYYVEQNFREKIRADEVAKLCGLSSFRFSRCFKDTYGIAFRDYVVRYRLREAYHMLNSGYASVTEAAYACGFNDVAYFSRVFKRHFTVSPSEVGKDTSALEMEDNSPTLALRLPIH
jgi:AraC-like DNA-binding protein